MQQATKRGRPQSIPAEHWATVFRLYGEGNGYRRIADLLIPLHVSTTKSSVERLIKGLPPYQGRRVVPAKKLRPRQRSIRQGSEGGGKALLWPLAPRL